MEHNDYNYYNAPTPQQEFDRQASSAWSIAAGLFTFIFLYLPVLTIGYAGASKLLDHKDSGLAWLCSTLLIAGIAYGGILLLKKLLLRYRRDGNNAWILLFIFCVGLTCLMTPVLAWEPISHAFARWHWPHWLAVATDVMIAAFIYLHYDFLESF